MKHKILFLFFILSFVCWLLPFIVRLFFVNIPEIQVKPIENPQSITITMDKIVLLLSENKKQDAFWLIFLNNIKGCLINIIGGFLLGLGTLINLMFNGFFMADIFASSYESNPNINLILRTTLPHSFELIGFWLSGAIGFYFAWNIIQFMRGKESFSSQFLKQTVIGILIVFIIIFSAAYVEAYISTSMSIK